MKIDKLSNEELQSLIEIQEAIVSDATHEKEFELKILSALQELKEYRIAKDEDRLMVLKPKEEAAIHIISTCLEACKVEVIGNIFDNPELVEDYNE